MENQPFSNPFSTTNLWRPSIFSDVAPEKSMLFTEPDGSLLNLDNPYIAEEAIQNDFKLPDLESFKYGPLENTPAPDGSVLSSDTEQHPTAIGEEEDIWRFASESEPASACLKYHTWESFSRPDNQEPCSAYISEAGPEAFNAALRVQGERRGHHAAASSVVNADIFLKSLLSLGLGRSSILFTYENKKRDFVRIIDPSTTTGYSEKLSKCLIDDTMACGRMIRHLKDFVDRTYATGRAFAARVALANAVDSILGSLELHLSEHAVNVDSLLQLQRAFSRPHRVLSETYDVVKSMKAAQSNEEIAKLMFKRCQTCEQEPIWLRNVMLGILTRVSRPWLELVEKWVGLQDDHSFAFEHSMDFVGNDPSAADNSISSTGVDYIYRPELMPTFIDPEDGQMIFDTGRSLRILRSHHPDHPLSRTSYSHDQGLSLVWIFEWQDMERIVRKAKEHEHSLAAAVKAYGASNHISRLVQEAAPSTDSTEPVSDHYASDTFTFHGPELFDVPLSAKPKLPDELYQIVSSSIAVTPQESISEAVFSPPVSLAPVLSFNPLLAAQSRLMNAASIRLFFRSHQLRKHLELQRHFHLLGDGVFVSRLTAALFDPGLSTTERQLGVMRSGTGMGLRLGSRGTWPPASSELRLALMGILTDCYQSSRLGLMHKSSLPNKPKELPGSLSFAIRHLDENEAEKILDPDSLHALDFLRLQYMPPSPLGAVLTPLALDKYDVVFKFLLRITRLLFVIAHLPTNFDSRNARLFRLQAHHFISACGTYFLETGVRETWDAFTSYLDDTERRLNEEDSADEIGTRVTEGIEDLRRQHELCLDRILFALLLRHRQQKVMGLLEEIFGTILEFSKACNTRETNAIDNDWIDTLYDRFHGKVGLFLEVCKGLIGKRGYGKPGGEARRGFGKGAAGDENTIERLVVALDYNGYYVRTAADR